MHRLAFLLLLPCAAAVLAAQAPLITPKGDPSVLNDTIYGLAVRPEDHPEDAAILLLDDGVVRYEADGRGTRTFRQVVQILKEEAIEGYAEQSFSHAPGHERLTVNWLRVVRPDGQVVSARPAQVQDADIPATMGNPVYSDRKMRRASLSGVAVGTIVDWSYTIEELKPFLRGDFYQSWGVTTGLPVRRSRLIVDLPATLEPRILEKNLDFARATNVKNGRRTYTWATKDVQTVKGEPFAADSNGMFMSLAIASPTTWQDIAKWYAGLARERYALTPAVESKVKEMVSGARTLDDSIRAIHRWVAQDIRYVSIALGLGGYQPRTPGTVLETGFGDCKDKATIFIAALAKLGITAYPVLLNSSGGVERSMPSIHQFDHAIAAVERPSGYLFVDLTSELTPLGSLPYSEQGEFALVVHPDGRGEEVTMPADPITANHSESRLVGSLSPKGIFEGRFEEIAGGTRQYALRDLFSTPLDSTRRANLQRSLATRLFDGASGDSLKGFNGKDLRAEPRFTMVIRNGRASTSSGDTEIFTVPFASMSELADLANELESRSARKFPIDAEEVIGAHTGRTEMRVTLPVGWRARLPRGVSATSAFGSYAAEYAQEGQELRITRRLTGAKGVLPPDRVGDLISWLKAVSADNARFIVLERP